MIRSSLPSFVRHGLRAASGVTAVLVLAGCASTPLSYLYDNQVYYRAVLHRDPVFVVAIDGRSSTFHPMPIEPGDHLLTLEAKPVAGFSSSVQKTLPFTAAPCTQYYIAAQRRSALAQDWDLVVEQTFATGACSAKEAPRAAAGGTATSSIASAPAVAR